MTANAQEQQPQPVETPKNDKEHNFAMIRQQLDRERAEKLVLQERVDKAEKLAQEALSKQQKPDDDDDTSDEPYIDERRLQKKLSKFSQQTLKDTDERINNAVHKALSEERKNSWLKNNPDFYEVMGHAQTFADKDPELAETILSMPEGFERQKLVYNNIKALGLHKKEDPKTSIQDKVDQNRRHPGYQPSGTAAPPFGVFTTGGKNWSPQEGKAAYERVQELKRSLRI